MKQYPDWPQIDPRARALVRVLFWGVCGITFVANLIVVQYYDNVVDAADVEAPVAIVLGGGMHPDGSQTRMQMDRVTTAIDLYHGGYVKALLMSGDDGQNRFNEIDAMKAQAIAAGVLEEDILLDPHAYRTYLSCYRAKHEYDIERAVVITQFFHIPRALYFCERQGIETVGVTADIGPYTNKHRLRMHIRDVFARVKGVWEMEVTKPSA